jgi:hypothetical protein
MAINFFVDNFEYYIDILSGVLAKKLEGIRVFKDL